MGYRLNGLELGVRYNPLSYSRRVTVVIRFCWFVCYILLYDCFKCVLCSIVNGRLLQETVLAVKVVAWNCFVKLCRQSNFKLKGIPVLFIPGSAGSYKQGDRLVFCYNGCAFCCYLVSVSELCLFYWYTSCTELSGYITTLRRVEWLSAR